MGGGSRQRTHRTPWKGRAFSPLPSALHDGDWPQPHDAVHDCEGPHQAYNEERAARSNDAAFTGRAQMAKWIRFERAGKTGFGTLEGDTIAFYTGEMFAGSRPSGERLKLSEVQILT